MNGNINFKNKRVTIMGLGLLGGGVGTVKFFVKTGAKVLVTDLRKTADLKDSLNKIKNLPVKFVLGRHREKDFKNCDLIIKNPAVKNDSPYLKIAKKNKIPIETEATIFFENCQGEIIGITGTKGKSTITYLTYLFLKTRFKNTILAGNIGKSLLEALFKIKRNSKIVLELSSSQLEDLKKSPKIALICNIFPDHLNRYKSLNEYLKTKSIIFRYQNKNDILVLDYDNKFSRNFLKSAPSQAYFYSKKEPKKLNFFKRAAFLKQGKIFFNDEKEPIGEWDAMLKSVPLSNVLAAISLAKILKVPSKNIREVLKKFKGLKERLDFVKEINGAKYFNDTTATIPEATIEAIKSSKSNYPKANIFLICGGEDKGLIYKNLAEIISKNIKKLILLSGTASDKIKKELIKKNFKIFYETNSIEKAVKKVKKLAKKGDIVLFSPAAASFNLFKNEFERGEKFRRALEKIEHGTNLRIDTNDTNK